VHERPAYSMLGCYDSGAVLTVSPVSRRWLLQRAVVMRAAVA